MGTAVIPSKTVTKKTHKVFDIPPEVGAPAGSPIRKGSASEAVLAWQAKSNYHEKREHRFRKGFLSVTRAYENRAKEVDATFELPDIPDPTAATKEIDDFFKDLRSRDQYLKEAFTYYDGAP